MGKTGTDGGEDDTLGEVALVWYKDSVVLVLAIISFLVSHYLLHVQGILTDPAPIIVPFVILLSILWFFGVFGIIFLLPFCLASLKTQIQFFLAAKIIVTRTAVQIMDYWGQITSSVPLAKVIDISHFYNGDDNGIRHGCPLPGTCYPDLIILDMAEGSHFLIPFYFITEPDKEKFLYLLQEGLSSRDSRYRM